MKPLETEVSRRPEVSGLPLDGTSPAGRLLGNGRWVTLLTAAGGGFSSLDGIALTRWRGDRVSDADGAFVYLRDLDTHGVRSLAHQPCRVPAERYDVTERPGVVTFTRRDDGLEASLDVCVVPGMQAELRRVTLRDHSGRARRIELTSYVEVVLHHAAADAAHPAFAKLFVQTQRASDPDALLARRRPRSPDESYPWLAHAVAGQRADQFETDRARFIGRGGSLAEPTALASGATLSGSVGNVLDPVLALRRVVRLEPNGFGSLTFVLAADAERDGVLALVRRLGEPLAVESAFAAAEDHALAELDRLGLSLDEAERAQALAVGMLYRVPELRASPVVLALAGSPQPAPPVAVPPGAWPVFVDARGEETGIALPALVRAQRLWETFGIRTAVMVLRDERTAPATPSLDGVQFVDASRVAPAFLDRWLADARLVLGPAGEPGATTGRSAARRRNGAGPRIARPASRAGSRNDTSGLTRGVDSPGAATWLAEPLLAWNGHGGFSEDGNEYVIRMPMTTPGRLRRPPLPWTNVLASERFGCLVSDTGAGPTWSRNSREHRLTPWCNDPVLDPHEEAVHVRDEDSGRFWSPLPGPTPGVGDYETRHGFGYSLFRHAGEGLEHETLVFVARNDPVKVVRVRLTNRTAGSRRLSLFSYQRLVLGVDPPASAHHVITEYSVEADALLAHGRARLPEGGVAFAAVVAPGGLLAHHVTGDRAAYLGRHGDIADPLAVASTRTLDDRTGAALDPCFAQQVLLELPAGATIECSFLFGEADHAEAARAVVHRYRIAGAIDAAAEEVRSFWSHLLGAVRVETPVPALDLALNGWMLYQTLACRMWGRTAFYQSGGAYGYRDQLQDSAAFLTAWPELTRAQILLHAAHQFVEGDVLHWWHPPLRRGIRTRFADDRLWLPYITGAYLDATSDVAILDERVPFLTARPLSPGEEEAFLEPAEASQAADLYQHCVRAIDCSLATGAHGLPLFGSGDWNDGMNRVGRDGHGESVWMAFFLIAILGDWAVRCARRGDAPRAHAYRAHRDRLRAAVEAAAWDGEWYRRGYYDDGTPLGSASSDECRIDALAQAWAVLSGAAPPGRAGRAMDAVERHLVREDEGLIRLLTPAFDRTPHDPGYIKGYLPGVRENGGQYTHAALWVVRAMAELGRTDRAAHLLEMLSPVSHGGSPERIADYQVEPYVIAADVYGEPPHVGRGGWTWYTGSAGWMHRVGIESVMGVKVVGGTELVVDPKVPPDWTHYRVALRGRDGRTLHEVDVVNATGEPGRPVEAVLDGSPVKIVDGRVRIPLRQDGLEHLLAIRLG